MRGPNEKAAEGQTRAALDTADRQVNPTEQQIDMQPCRQLFAELAHDNVEKANQLSDQLRSIADEDEKRSMKKRIFDAMLMATRFKAGAMRHLTRAVEC